MSEIYFFRRTTHTKSSLSLRPSKGGRTFPPKLMTSHSDTTQSSSALHQRTAQISPTRHISNFLYPVWPFTTQVELPYSLGPARICFPSTFCPFAAPYYTCPLAKLCRVSHTVGCGPLPFRETFLAGRQAA